MSRSLSLALVVLGALSAFGCAYKRTESVSANGEDRVLYFTGVVGADLGVVPLGATRTVHVARLPGGQVDCHPLGIKGGVHTQGGGHPDLPSDTCDTIPPEPTDVEAATCDDDACTVTWDTAKTGITLHVTAKEEKSTHLRVTLKSTKDGALYSDAIAVRFAPAKRVRLRGRPRDLLPLRTPVLPGVAVDYPEADVVDANDEPMSLDEGALERSLRGTGWEPGEYEGLVAKTAGHGTMHWEVPGIISRDLDLEIVDPSSAVALEIGPLETAPAYDDPAVDLDTAPAVEATPIDAVELASSRAPVATFPTRAVLSDGRRALPAIDRVVVTPTIFAKASPDLSASWVFDIDAAPAVGEGSLEVDAGPLSLTLPLRVGPPLSR